MTDYCGRCVERTVATHLVTASGGEPSINELVCAVHLDAVRDRALRRPNHSVELVDRSADYCRAAAWRTTDPGQIAKAMRVPKPPTQDVGQLDLFDEGGAA